MITVVIPALLESLCKGRRKLEVEATTLDETLRALDAECPGIYDRIVEDGRVRPQLAIAVNGEVYQMPLHERLKTGTELTIVPAIGGGA
jgi:molybdopterin converting factor small subunit